MAERKWIPVTERLPECTKWDEDRGAMYGPRVLTDSPIHGIRIMFTRMDDFMWPPPVINPKQRTQERTFKWGITHHDPSITHWMELP